MKPLLTLAAAAILPWLFPTMAAAAGAPSPSVADLLRDPTPAEWRALSRFDGTLTRSEFESSLDQVFDPWHGLGPYLKIGSRSFAVYGTADRSGAPWAVIRFASWLNGRRPLPVDFRSPEQFRGRFGIPPGPPLTGLRVAIEPADIGGRWAQMEDRSVYFRGYGRINEGDLNLIVGRRLAERLTQMGATVFLVRNRTEPILDRPETRLAEVEDLLRYHPGELPETYRFRMEGAMPTGSRQIASAAGLLLTKTLETRARAALVRRSFRPDLTLVLQHDGSPESGEGRLFPSNRNIFFVDGAYQPVEMRDPEQRFRLLTKLLEEVTPIETEVAARIAARFQAATGFPPVLYGNSSNTRLVLADNPYVVARNIAFNREHDGPVVVTEPYFMNQPDTLARLLAGDYAGERIVAGKRRSSIFREYADTVAQGVLDAYVR